MIDLDSIQRDPSPNFSARPDLSELAAIVVHYTAGGSAGSSIRWLCNPAARASAHYVIARDGLITELVPPDQEAWHAGVAELVIDGESISNVNERTIGIELANHGLLIPDGPGGFGWQCGRRIYPYRQDADPVLATLRWDTGHEVEGWWEPYAEPQLDALGHLIDSLIRRYPQLAGQLVGHDEIAMPVGRKLDVGPLFPWDRFRRSIPRRTSGRIAA